MKQVYLDNQANTRVDERVVDALLPYLRENYGNAQSMHSLGVAAKEAVETARHRVAALIGATADEIYFASCGSEANNLAIKGAAEAYRRKGRHIVISSIEHFSVVNAAKRLEQSGFEVTMVPVDRYGTVAPADVQKALRDDTALVSVQYANTEIGTVQSVAEIAQLVREKGVIFHSDAVAAAGTVPIDVEAIGVDLLSLSGTQFYGPKGGAALYVRKGVRLVPQIDGGVQEYGRRAGTENVPAIVGLGAASVFAKAEMAENVRKMAALRNRLIEELPRRIEYCYLNGHPERRLPGNVNFSIEFVEGEGMFLLLDAKGIMVSSGSACASKALKMSHVLSAVGTDPVSGQGSILMSLSKYTTDEDIDHVLSEFPPVVKKLRELSPLYAYFLKTGQRRAAGHRTA
jgi:cysteine desulfurase